MAERAPLVTAARIDDLANRAWPALESHRIGGWLVRISHGVTRRANSVLPAGDVEDLDAAIDDVEALYRQHGIRPTFQLSPASMPKGLAARLERRGYTEDAETLILIAPTDQIIDATTMADGTVHNGRLSVHNELSEKWLSLWWQVDGRGGEPEREVARKILAGNPSLYATVNTEASDPVAVGRLALVDDWGGLFAVATHPGHRRRGHARRIVGTLAREARAAGAFCLWLQVMAENEVALALYRSLGFEPVSGYSYWVAPRGVGAL